jgi:hypothetical protein
MKNQLNRQGAKDLFFDRIDRIFRIIFFFSFRTRLRKMQSAAPRKAFAKRTAGMLMVTDVIKLLITAHIYYGHRSSTKSLSYHFLQQAPDNPLSLSETFAEPYKTCLFVIPCTRSTTRNPVLSSISWIPGQARNDD